MKVNKLLLVGDNPFHGISHLSQERAISRGKDISDPRYASNLVSIAMDSGADGFMFSVSGITLSILKQVCREKRAQKIKIYALVPYVFELVRMAVVEGGTPGLAKKIGWDIVMSANINALIQGFKGFVKVDPASLLKAYLLYVESSIRSIKGRNGLLSSIIIHEVLTDMALSLNMEWLIKTHIELMKNRGIKPGFDTHNFPYLVHKLQQWGVDCRELTITTQFNSIGFGMSPSREQYEDTLKIIPETEVIAYGILGSGYLKLTEAIEYVKTLPLLKGFALGISRESQARESFKLFRENLSL